MSAARTLPSDEQADREWFDAWALIAAACDAGLTVLHPLHPRRDEFRDLTRLAHRATDPRDGLRRP